MLSSLLSALLLGLAAPALAQADDDFGGYGYSSSYVNISARSPSWERAYKASNATGSITFTGYDVSLPWPGKPLDGWTISATGVDLSKLDDVLTAEGKRRVIGDDVRIVAPSSIYARGGNSSTNSSQPVVNVHEDWVFCAWPWYLPPSGNNSLQNNPDNLASTPDGSCKQWVSNSCISALESVAKTAYEFTTYTEGPWGQKHKCKNLNVPSACRGYMTQSQPITSSWGVPLKYLNGSTTFQDGYSLDNRDTPADQKARWQTITHSYRPILTLFGRNSSDPNAKVESGFAKLVCLRAQEKNEVYEPAKDSSNNNGSGGKNGASGVSTTWALLLTIVIAVMAWNY